MFECKSVLYILLLFVTWRNLEKEDIQKDILYCTDASQSREGEVFFGKGKKKNYDI